MSIRLSAIGTPPKNITDLSFKLRRRKYWQQNPVTLDVGKLPWDGKKHLIEVKSICFPGKHYCLDLVSLTCDCPEVGWNNMCFHLKELLSIDAGYFSNFGVDSEFSLTELKVDSLIYALETSVEKVMRFEFDGHKIVVLIHSDSLEDCEGILNGRSKFDYSQSQKHSFCSVFIDDVREGYSIHHGRWTYSADLYAATLRYHVETYILKYLYPDLFYDYSDVKVCCDGMQQYKASVNLGRIQINGVIKKRGKVLHLSSNVLGSISVRVSSGSAGLSVDYPNDRFDYRYTHIQDVICSLYSSIHEFKQG